MTVKNPKTNWKKQYIEMKAAAESLKEELEKTKLALVEEMQACEDLKASNREKAMQLGKEEALNRSLSSRAVTSEVKAAELEKRLELVSSNLKRKTESVENMQKDLDILFRRFHKIPEFIRWIFGAN